MDPQPKPLTARQRAILVSIRDFGVVNGWPPTIRQIGAIIGVQSTSVIEHHLKVLTTRGLITRQPGQSRALSLTYAGLAALEAEVTV